MDAASEFLESLRWTLRSLDLAGVKRVPRLFSAETGGAAAAAAPVGAQSWAEVARFVKSHIETESAAWARSSARTTPAGAPSDHAVARRNAGARGRSPAGAAPSARGPKEAPAAEPDPALRPSSPVDPDVDKQLAELAATVSKCTRCKALVASRTQTVFCDGPPNADLMFIGEAPGEEEDRQGVAFVGRAGQLLTRIITGGMRMRRQDTYICNILKCRPPGNRNPLPQESANCREYLDRQIELVAPKVICCLGGVASRFLLDDPTAVGKMRGRWHQYRGIPVRVTYHPAYLLRNYTADARQKVWDDVRQVADKLRELGTRPGGPRESSTELF